MTAGVVYDSESGGGSSSKPGGSRGWRDLGVESIKWIVAAEAITRQVVHPWYSGPSAGTVVHI